MKELLKVLSKPRSIYFSIVAMLTLTLVLMKISFSYYIPLSVDKGELKVPDLKNVLTVNGYETNELVFEPNESKELTLKVNSENEIESSFAIFYEGENFTIEPLTAINSKINPFEEKKFIIKVTNNLDTNNTIKLDIKSGFNDKTIEVTENIIK